MSKDEAPAIPGEALKSASSDSRTLDSVIDQLLPSQPVVPPTSPAVSRHDSTTVPDSPPETTRPPTTQRTTTTTSPPPSTSTSTTSTNKTFTTEPARRRYNQTSNVDDPNAGCFVRTIDTSNSKAPIVIDTCVGVRRDVSPPWIVGEVGVYSVIDGQAYATSDYVVTSRSFHYEFQSGLSGTVNLVNPNRGVKMYVPHINYQGLRRGTEK